MCGRIEQENLSGRDDPGNNWSRLMIVEEKRLKMPDVKDEPERGRGVEKKVS